jgi:hypothetical protein
MRAWASEELEQTRALRLERPAQLKRAPFHDIAEPTGTKGNAVRAAVRAATGEGGHRDAL